MFVERGWAATGVRSVAEQAGVSVKTIYDGFGSKAELFKAVIDVAAAGDDEPVMVMEREQFVALADGDLGQRAAAGARLALAVNRRRRSLGTDERGVVSAPRSLLRLDRPAVRAVARPDHHPSARHRAAATPRSTLNHHDTDMTGSVMADTRTMPIVHSALRRDLTRTRIVLTDSRSLSEERRTALADHLAWMMTFLDRHHTSEVEGLYPMVLRKNPAARAFRAPGTIATTDVLAAIDALEAVLYPHLAREEDETRPVVATSITAADWHRWDQEHNVEGLSFRELAATGLWTLDGQDPASHALMRQVAPPSSPLSTSN